MKAIFINRLKQSWSHKFMNLKRSLKYLLCQFFVFLSIHIIGCFASLYSYFLQLYNNPSRPRVFAVIFPVKS